MNHLAEVLVLLAMAIGSVATPAQTGGVATTAAPRPPIGGPLAQATPPPLRVVGRHFVDPAGRVVILRGVSLSGSSKVPPFPAITSTAELDLLSRLGMNVVRLLFLWEAYEPLPGVYDEAYLARLRAVAHAAWERGMYVIVDIHQDGFSRFASRGSGDGFPPWAISPRGRPSRPDNSPRARLWPLLMATDPTTYRSFTDFYSDTFGVRTRYLAMVARVADGFAPVPGVVGYDLLNEPWGDEWRDLAPLYRDAAAMIHACHPSALLFLEGQITTNCGLQTRLPPPTFPNAVYAPHYYKPLPIYLGHWYGIEHNINRAFDHMTATAAAWEVPLFVGEFGLPAGARNADAYITAIYDRLDASLASGAQWNYTPDWNEQSRDGWDGEDFSIVGSGGALRPNFRLRPYPRFTAGVPLRFAFRAAESPQLGATLEFIWAPSPDRGVTEIFVPAALFPPGSALAVEPVDVACLHDPARQVLVCRAARPLTVVLRLTGPAPCPLMWPAR